MQTLVYPVLLEGNDWIVRVLNTPIELSGDNLDTLIMTLQEHKRLGLLERTSVTYSGVAHMYNEIDGLWITLLAMIEAAEIIEAWHEQQARIGYEKALRRQEEADVWAWADQKTQREEYLMALEDAAVDEQVLYNAWNAGVYDSVAPEICAAVKAQIQHLVDEDDRIQDELDMQAEREMELRAWDDESCY